MNDLRPLLDSLQAIRHAGDLDLLLFFARHPSVLMTDDRIAAVLGYSRDSITESLDALVQAGFLSRTQKSKRSARLHVLQLDTAPVALSAVLKIAATRQGRDEIMRLLASTGGSLPKAGPNPAR